ncbi:MAG: L,D-transpeptidase, partial [Armatimonadota bacterium]
MIFRKLKKEFENILSLSIDEAKKKLCPLDQRSKSKKSKLASENPEKSSSPLRAESWQGIPFESEKGRLQLVIYKDGLSSSPLSTLGAEGHPIRGPDEQVSSSPSDTFFKEIIFTTALLLLFNFPSFQTNGIALSYATEEEIEQSQNPAIDSLPKIIKENISYYQVQEPITVEELVKQFNMTVKLFQELNEPSKDRFDAQDTVRIIHLDYKIVIDRAERALYLVTADGRLIGKYKVGVGKPGRSTPLGTFKIFERFEHKPFYINTDSGKISRYGKKGYPYGDLGIYLRIGMYLGIHSTSWQDSVGEASSKGCIRMDNEGILEVDKIVPNGTVVIITDSKRDRNKERLGEL